MFEQTFLGLLLGGGINEKNPEFSLYVDLQLSFIKVDIYGFYALSSEKGRAYMLGTLVSLEKCKTNIDDVELKRRNPEPKKWSLFVIVGTYSSGVKMTLKVRITPMETTSIKLNFKNLHLSDVQHF